VRVLRHAGVLVLGAVVALASVVVHRADALGLPVGLGLAVLASVSGAWWLRRSGVPRTAATYGLGWLAVLAGALVGRPEGDYVLAGDVSGYTLMGTGFVLVAVGVTSLAARPAHLDSPG